MPRKVLLISALTLATALAGSLLSPAAAVTSGGGDQSSRVVLAVEGMTCGGCVAAVKSALKKTEGVTSYEVSLEKKEADVRFEPARTDPERIAAAVSKTGFKATVKSVEGTANERE